MQQEWDTYYGGIFKSINQLKALETASRGNGYDEHRRFQGRPWQVVAITRSCQPFTYMQALNHGRDGMQRRDGLHVRQGTLHDS